VRSSKQVRYLAKRGAESVHFFESLFQAAILAAALLHPSFSSLGGPVSDIAAEEEEADEPEHWQYSLSTYTYVVRHGPDYVNPNLTVDRGWFHLESRYNYEELKTGAILLGYNFTTGDQLEFDATPMLGGVFGNLTGIAPGFRVSLLYGKFEFSTEGEYLLDPGNSRNNFFYNWTELSVAPVSGFRVGLVLDRSTAFGTSSGVGLGPLVGLKRKNVDFTTYWIAPGSRDAAFVFGVTFDF
jgi:hypothetical protein